MSALGLELRDVEAERWVGASIALIRPLRPEESRWLLAALAERPALPPLGVVADVGRLLAGARLESRPAPLAWDARLRAALRGYEDHLLARLAADPLLEAAQDAFSALPVAQRPAAVGLFVARVLDRLGASAGAALSPAVARRVLERPARELIEVSRSILLGSDPLGAAVTAAYEELARAARRVTRLIGEAEVFLLERFEALGDLHQRLALAQVVEAAEELDRALPRTVKPRPTDRGEAPSELEEDAAYPLGGFASLTNAGSLENLVTSELAFMDEGGGLDLFDVRYAEGELLYYARDESLAVRRRQVVTFVLLPSLVRARVKDPELRWQRLIAAMALVLTTVRRLSRSRSDESVSFRVAFVREPGGELVLAAERGLLEVLLREWLERRAAEIVAVDSLEEAVGSIGRRAQASVLILGVADRPPELSEHRHLRCEVLDLGAPAPWQAWTDACRRVLETAGGCSG